MDIRKNSEMANCIRYQSTLPDIKRYCADQIGWENDNTEKTFRAFA